MDKLGENQTAMFLLVLVAVVCFAVSVTWNNNYWFNLLLLLAAAWLGYGLGGKFGARHAKKK